MNSIALQVVEILSDHDTLYASHSNTQQMGIVAAYASGIVGELDMPLMLGQPSH